jgi:hypothetical protein
MENARLLLLLRAHCPALNALQSDIVSDYRLGRSEVAVEEHKFQAKISTN